MYTPEPEALATPHYWPILCYRKGVHCFRWHSKCSLLCWILVGHGLHWEIRLLTHGTQSENHGHTFCLWTCHQQRSSSQIGDLAMLTVEPRTHECPRCSAVYSVPWMHIFDHRSFLVDVTFIVVCCLTVCTLVHTINRQSKVQSVDGGEVSFCAYNVMLCDRQ